MKQFHSYFWPFLWKVKTAFRPKKPKLIFLLALRLFETKILKAKRLRYVDIALEYKCNQKCHHCFATTYIKDNPPENKLLSREEYKRIFSESTKLGALSFSIQGGEPLADINSLTTVLQAIDKSRSLISIKTNGSLINKDRLKTLKNLGVDIITISIDSGIQKEHDQFRGMENAWIKAMNGLKLAKKFGFSTLVACTVSKLNFQTDGFLELIKITKENRTPLLLILAAPSGNWQGNTDILLSEKEVNDLYVLKQKHTHLLTDFDANWCTKGCGAMKEILYISQYGDVMSCPFIQVSFGNIFKQSIAEIWLRGIKIPPFNKYASKCLIGEDQTFIRNYCEAFKKTKKTPVPIEYFLTTENKYFL